MLNKIKDLELVNLFEQLLFERQIIFGSIFETFGKMVYLVVQMFSKFADAESKPKVLNAGGG